MSLPYTHRDNDLPLHNNHLNIDILSALSNGSEVLFIANQKRSHLSIHFQLLYYGHFLNDAIDCYTYKGDLFNNINKIHIHLKCIL